MINLQNINKKIEDRIIIDNLNLSVKKGEFVVIMGKSGSGKSTLLKLIGGLLKLDSGRIIIDKMEISKFDTNRWADYRLENMGIVFQDFQLLDVFTTYENIIFPSKILKKESNDIIKSKANTYIKMANLVREKNKNIRELSGGEKQRVAFIRAFMNNPKIILADEPTGSLDYKNSQILIDFISKSIKELGQTMIMVTHDSYVAANADKVYFLKDGQIISKLVLDKSSNERLNENIDLVQKELLKITT